MKLLIIVGMRAQREIVVVIPSISHIFSVVFEIQYLTIQSYAWPCPIEKCIAVYHHQRAHLDFHSTLLVNTYAQCASIEWLVTVFIVIAK